MRRTIGWAGICVAATAVLGLTVNMAPAGAESDLAMAPAHPGNSTASGAAGYSLKAPVSATAQDTFKVPLEKCTSTLSGVSMGAFIFSSSNLTTAAVWVTCQSGKAIFVGDLVANGHNQFTTLTPKPGDIVTASVSQSATASKATLKDVTQNKSQSLTGTGTKNVVILDGIDSLVSTSGGQVPVPNFSVTPYTGATEDGKTLAADHATAYNFGTSTVLKILTGPLSSAGNAFTETFKHS